jgi:hypothetical protein
MDFELSGAQLRRTEIGCAAEIFRANVSLRALGKRYNRAPGEIFGSC